MTTIIISYRRDDTKWITGRIFDRLKSHYGSDKVFIDIDNIPYGMDFRDHLRQVLDRCDILVAVIGPKWAALNEAGRSRLQEEADWVRLEVATALAKKIPVIPLLVDSTQMPRSSDLPEDMHNLLFRNAAPVDSGRDFHNHMDRLIKTMDALLGEKPAPPGRSWTTRIAGVLLIGLGLALFGGGSSAVVPALTFIAGGLFLVFWKGRKEKAMAK